MTALEKARNGGGPSLIEAMTYRHFGHSRADPGKYRPDEEVKDWKENKDPVINYRAKLLKEGIKEAELAAVDARAEELIDIATEEAKNSPPPPAEIAFTDVWADGSATWRN
jgi:pyruvate dehydrogenase E1 component alpha subunit